MPEGKKAGIRCVNLLGNNTCSIYDAMEYPAVCANLKSSLEMCGKTDNHAFAYLTKLEELTRPD
jgi:hypothetical protein